MPTPAQRRVEAAQTLGAGGDELLALEARHDDLVLMAGKPVRPEQKGTVAVFTSGSRTEPNRAEPHAMATCAMASQVQPARDERLDRGDDLQVAALLLFR